jgi:hypothetical protein
MKRSLLTFALVLVSLLAASSALAAAPPPKVILQLSDFAPAAKARVTQSGPSGKGSGFAEYEYLAGSRPMELSVSVATLPSVQMAKAFFKELKNDELSFPGQQLITLPRYGDEQLANFGGAGSQLIVRKNRVVWQIALQTVVASGPKYVRTKAQATAEYKKYAPKQQRRVGNG